MVNQFRQLYVVKSVDDNNNYIVNKLVNKDNFATLAGDGSTTGNLYVATAKFVLIPTTTSAAYSSSTDYYTKDSKDKMTKDANTTSTTYKDGSHYFLDTTGASGGYVRLANTDVYVSNTTYYSKNEDIPNEVGEINWKVANLGDGVNKFIYFTYVGLGKDKNGQPTVSRSPLIDPKNIVSIKAVKPAELNKNKLKQQTTLDFSAVNIADLPAKVILTINFTNFANGDSSIFPFTVNADKGASTSDTVANLVKAINEDTRIADLSGNTLVVASDGGSSKLVITAQACGTYELGMQDVYYPKFTVTNDIYGNVYGGNDSALQVPQETEFLVDSNANNGDVAAEMELVYMGERMQSGLPFNYPFNVNSKTMVDPTANYSCIDIHYYIDNDMDFSQRSHGTVTLLCEESANNDFSVINAVLGTASSGASAGTLNAAIYNSGEKIGYIANLS